MMIPISGSGNICWHDFVIGVMDRLTTTTTTHAGGRVSLSVKGNQACEHEAHCPTNRRASMSQTINVSSWDEAAMESDKMIMDGAKKTYMLRKHEHGLEWWVVTWREQDAIQYEKQFGYAPVRESTDIIERNA